MDGVWEDRKDPQDRKELQEYFYLGVCVQDCSPKEGHRTPIEVPV